MSEKQSLPLSNRPHLSELNLSAQTSQIYVVIAASNEPISTSEIAQSFSKGEELITVVVEALDVLHKTGRIEIEKRGWYCPGEQSARSGSLVRRFGNWQIDALERHFSEHRDSLDELELLLAEMSRRKPRPRNQRLAEGISMRISELRQDDPGEFKLESD